MTAEQIQQLLTEKFGSQKIVGGNMQAIDPWIEVAPAAILEVCRFLRDDSRMKFEHLNDLCGVDYCEPDPKKAAKFGHEPHVEVVYHLSSYELRHKITVKVKLPRWKNEADATIPEVDSVASIWGIADWHEREAYDLVGIRFLGHPNLRRILCPEDWVGHPLRKDYEFPLEYHGIRGK
ncbi:MAG: NADH-quinone oxidoreductase subunit C [Planctomycetaceae bacterium]